jgi:hypothetical protein
VKGGGSWLVAWWLVVGAWWLVAGEELRFGKLREESEDGLREGNPSGGGSGREGWRGGGLTTAAPLGGGEERESSSIFVYGRPRQRFVTRACPALLQPHRLARG